MAGQREWEEEKEDCAYVSGVVHVFCFVLQMGIVGLSDKDVESYSRLYELANSAMQSSST